jgi:cytidine deaminase
MLFWRLYSESNEEQHMATNIASLDQLSHDVQELLRAAKDVSRFAYNKYSRFAVGAALTAVDSRVFRGANMENASYGLTICAEAAALAAANSEGARHILRVAVVGGAEAVGSPVTPCGRCRQLLFEGADAFDQDIDIYCSDLSLQNIVHATIRELLPLAFGPGKD